MINISKQAFILKLILVLALQLTAHNVYAFSAENSAVDQETKIPYKKENPGVETAKSKFIIMFVVLLVLAISIYVISKKYSLNLWQRYGAESDIAVRIMLVKRLTANSTILQINIDGKIYTFLESKSNIKLISPE